MYFLKKIVVSCESILSLVLVDATLLLQSESVILKGMK